MPPHSRRKATKRPSREIAACSSEPGRLRELREDVALERAGGGRGARGQREERDDSDGLWRPVTAIRGADDDLNDATAADPAWSPLITTPPHPSHASNQACVGASAARALARAFGSDNLQFDVTSAGAGTPPNPDVTCQYTRFWALADEQANSRVYAGIHYTFELTASQISCIQVADYVFEHYMRPRHRLY